MVLPPVTVPIVFKVAIELTWDKKAEVSAAATAAVFIDVNAEWSDEGGVTPPPPGAIAFAVTPPLPIAIVAACPAAVSPAEAGPQVPGLDDVPGGPNIMSKLDLKPLAIGPACTVILFWSKSAPPFQALTYISAI